MERRGAFDYILLETSGLADPGNIAPLFWVDDGLGSTIYLDGIVTLVDAKNVERSLDEATNPGSKELAKELDPAHGEEMTIAHLQISHADIIILNKIDTVSEKDLEGTKLRIQSINSLARLETTEYGKLPALEGVVLDLHAYDDVETLDTSRKGHSHLDPSIGTVTIDVPLLSSEDEEAQVQRVDLWFQSILWERRLPNANLPAPASASASAAAAPATAAQTQTPPEEDFSIHRTKALLRFKSGRVKMVQGVREVFEIRDLSSSPQAQPGGDEKGKIVLIGRNVVGWDWARSLHEWLGYKA